MRLIPGLVLTLIAANAFGADAMTLVWSDEFDRDGLPDPAKWGYEVGMIRNNELQFYTKARAENARVEGGNLVITARKEDFKGATSTSASLNTRATFPFTYGRVEVRAKLPTGRGTWPAIWTLGVDHETWPACGEIDIMEFVGFDPGVIHANIHTKAYNHVQKTGKGSSTRIPDASETFHVYAIEWSPTHLHFYVDDIRYFTYANDSTGPAAWPFDRDHYLILNLAIGGAWGGQKGVDADAFPQRLEVDYVRVYQDKAVPKPSP